jgi:hypothetical protein
LVSEEGTQVATGSIPKTLDPADVSDADGMTLVTVKKLPTKEMRALPATSRSAAYLAGEWVIKSAARTPAREEYRRNQAAFRRKAPIAEPMAVVKEKSSGHEFLAEQRIEGTTLAAQFLEVAKSQDKKKFDALYKRFRKPFEALAQKLFVELSLAADLKLSNIFDTPDGLIATDAWLADCSDRKLKHFSDYHPERSFNHMVLQIADTLSRGEYKAVHGWLTEQIVRLDNAEADNIKRYSRKLSALRATYGLL